MVGICEKLKKQKRYKTIVLPGGTLNPYESTTIEIGPNYQGTSTLIARPKPNEPNVTYVTGLPDFDDKYSPDPEQRKALTATLACQNVNSEEDTSSKRSDVPSKRTRSVQTDDYDSTSEEDTTPKKKTKRPATSTPKENAPQPSFNASAVSGGQKSPAQERAITFSGCPAINRMSMLNRAYNYTYPGAVRPHGLSPGIGAGSPYGMRRAGGQSVLGYSPSYCPAYSTPDFTPQSSRSYTPYSLGISSDPSYPTYQSSGYVPPCVEQDLRAGNSTQETFSQRQPMQVSCPCPGQTTPVRRNNLSINQSAPPVLVPTQQAVSPYTSAASPASVYSSQFGASCPSSLQGSMQQTTWPGANAPPKYVDSFPSMSQTAPPAVSCPGSMNNTQNTTQSSYYSAMSSPNQTSYMSASSNYGTPRSSTPSSPASRPATPLKSAMRSSVPHSPGCPYSHPPSPPVCQKPDCPSNFVSNTT